MADEEDNTPCTLHNGFKGHSRFKRLCEICAEMGAEREKAFDERVTRDMKIPPEPGSKDRKDDD